MSKSIEWKKQDKIFCVLPFVQHYISTQGWSELCCDASYKGRDYESKLDWNSKNLVKARQLFNEGKWPSECGFCISREQQGGKSLRMLSNKQWQREYDHFFNNPTVHPPLPISYDLRLGNFCNLECVMCNPESSDKIGKSMNAYFGNKPNTIYDGDTFRSSDYTEKQMIDKILNDPTNVKKIYLSGGEPFIMPGVLHLLEKLCDSGHSKHIKLHVSTNATVLRTEWTLAANGFKFRWKAQITERIDLEKLKWESVGGLPTRGSVLFKKNHESSTLVTLSITYELPKMIARLMEENILGKMVTNELQANIDRFKDLVEKNYCLEKTN